VSKVKISDKRKRTYERKFDHEEAAQLHGEGESYSALGRRYGVTPMTVRRVVLGIYSEVGRGETT